MDDLDFLRAWEDYPEPPDEANRRILGVRIHWIEDHPRMGVAHIRENRVEPWEVEDVLFRVPPEVEARKNPDRPDRTYFWGATRYDRWLFVACLDEDEEGTRVLTPITAFEPPDGRAYWESQEGSVR